MRDPTVRSGDGKGAALALGSPGIPAHLGSAGLVGRPGFGSSRRRVAPYLPATPDVARAGRQPMTPFARPTKRFAPRPIAQSAPGMGRTDMPMARTVLARWVCTACSARGRSQSRNASAMARCSSLDRGHPIRFPQRRFADHPHLPVAQRRVEAEQNRVPRLFQGDGVEGRGRSKGIPASRSRPRRRAAVAAHPTAARTPRHRRRDRVRPPCGPRTARAPAGPR